MSCTTTIRPTTTLSVGIPGGLLWLVLLLLLSSTTTLAFTQPQDPKRPQQVPRLSRRRTSNNHKDTPFFALERRLPPLSPIQTRRSTLPAQYSTNQGGPANETTTLTIPYSSSCQEEVVDDPAGPQALPVLYTNCPKRLNRWLVDHVPMEACAIGFDTEVGFGIVLFCEKWRMVGNNQR